MNGKYEAYTIERLHIIAELPDSHCELNHGPGIDNTKIPASNIIIVPFGTKTELVETVEKELIIPICSECNKGLIEDEWVLIYCFICHSNHWISKAHARYRYRHHILWLRGCPECGGEFGGLYFNDPEHIL